MQNYEETAKISQFLCAASPIITAFVKMLLQSAGLEVTEKGRGLGMAFSIKAGEKIVEFHLHNLLLEIATVDRDETPMRFDERLRDFGFFIGKTAHFAKSKLEVLSTLLSEDDVNAAISKISQLSGQFERIRIWQLDPDKPT
jgi:hypothetical protein